MRAHYDFSKMKGVKNPYIGRLKQPITIRLKDNRLEPFCGRMKKNIQRLARECAKLDPEFERAIAEEGLMGFRKQKLNHGCTRINTDKKEDLRL